MSYSADNQGGAKNGTSTLRKYLDKHPSGSMNSNGTYES